MLAAALTRRLVMQRGWRWNDVLILCRDLDAYAAPLSSAFALYSVPVFLASSRPAARRAAAECLLTALRALEKGFQQEDMFALIQTGLMPITADEGDRLMNYAIRYGLRGARFLRPLRRGTEAEIAEMEPGPRAAGRPAYPPPRGAARSRDASGSACGAVRPFVRNRRARGEP